MKCVFKFLSFGIIIAFYSIFASSIFAQATLEECGSIYQKFKENRLGPEFEKYKTAIATGKEYLEKCSNLKDQEVIKDYVTKQLSKLDDIVYPKHNRNPHENRFNTAVLAKNWDEAIAVSKELINQNRPYSLDLMLVIASIGYDQASANPPVDKYNDDALLYAKMALQKMSEGVISGAGGDYGFFQFVHKTKECPDGKLNATGWMNYIIGYITYTRLKQPKEALPYLYQATQVGCFTKKYSEVYRLIGAWYLEEFIKVNKSRAEKIYGLEPDELKANLAMQRIYAERALDAYARAYQFAGQHSDIFKYRESLLKRVKEFYDIRYEGDLTGLDSYLKNVMNTSFIDPTTPVTPVTRNH